MQDFGRNSPGLRTLSVLFKSGQSPRVLSLRNDHYTDMSASERIGYHCNNRHSGNGLALRTERGSSPGLFLSISISRF